MAESCHQQRRARLDRRRAGRHCSREFAGRRPRRVDPGCRSPDRDGGDPVRSLRRPAAQLAQRLGLRRSRGFWFTDFGKLRARSSDRGGLYYAHADGSRIEEKIFPLERPNGIGLSSDGKRLYVAETPTARCWAYDVEAPGVLLGGAGLYGDRHHVLAGLGGHQFFDSLAVDYAGHICVATDFTGAVSDIWPDGSRVDQYLLPDPIVTNDCFGGQDLRTAFATLSMRGRLVAFEWPRPGATLKYLNRP